MIQENIVVIYDTMKSSLKHDNRNGRFIIISESASAHCCFCYTVIDTEAGKKAHGHSWERVMCETFDKEEAVMICRALNEQLAGTDGSSVTT